MGSLAPPPLATPVIGRAEPSGFRLRRGLAIPVVALLLFGLVVAVSWTTVIDDAYIFFRYAANIASGTGYVFNAGEPVEGATSVSWTLLLAAVALAGANLPSAAVLLGVVLAGATLVLIWWALTRDGTSPLPTLLALTLLIVAPGVVPSMLLGLETSFYFLLLTAFFVVLARPDRAVLAGLTGVALFLTRPEALAILLLTAIGLVAAMSRVRRMEPAVETAPRGPAGHETRLRGLGRIGILVRAGGRRGRRPLRRRFNRRTSFSRMTWKRTRRSVLTIIGIWVIGVGLITGWRLLTFGDFVPNSVRAKSAWPALLADPAGLTARTLAGVAYLGESASAAWPLLLLGLVGWLALARRDAWAAFVAVAILTTGALAVLVNGGDWMPFHRLLTPYLGVVAILAGGGIGWLLARLPASRQRLGDLLVIVATLLALGPTLARLPSARPFQADEWPQAACYWESARILRDHLPADATLAPEAIGAVGYALPTTRIFDVFGLTEPAIARHGALPSPTFTFGKHDAAATMARRPDAFLFHSDANNHVARLSLVGYAEAYRTYRLSTPTCWLLVGLRADRVAATLGPLRQAFMVEPVAPE